ncbi:Aste57867_4777 [Aphanomyces stellatus]|uniref:Aste57867_4777 protein n=1 Tax=Aphanomyces stellatus TaxID=120398 RepID=A0A485KCC6_9STRA|nr:hypothetical protein As57867_004764 [Aphanomyces stellatus]VFT81872.1 Aste57867_4777 [Aphanomyces stellatus]
MAKHTVIVAAYEPSANDQDTTPPAEPAATKPGDVLKRTCITTPEHKTFLSSDVPMTRREAVEAAAGVLYVIGSVAWGVWYLLNLFPSVANDMWWPNFNATGPQTFLGDMCNLVLAVSDATTDLNMFSKSNGWIKDYSKATTVMQLSPVYPRMLVMQSTTNLEDAIRGIHATSLTLNMRMVTQYCWADFDKQFQLAHTALRQARCNANDADNAAVHLESLLRNVAWVDMVNTYGGPGGVFDVVVGMGVREFPGGAAWLASVHNAFVDVPTEAAYWRLKGSTRWQLLWHNAWQVGVDETITITNAVGMDQNLALKKIPYVHRGAAWNSIILYYGFWNELSTDYAANVSLVRNSTMHPPNDSFFQNYAGISAVPAALGWLAYFGPYGSIDTKFVTAPTSLATAYLAFANAVGKAIDNTPWFAELTSGVVNPTPPSWLNPNLLYYGGSPVCTRGVPQPYVQESFGFTDGCLAQNALAVTLDPTAVVFALFGTIVDGGMALADQLFNFCALCSTKTKPICIDVLTKAAAVYTSMDMQPSLKQLFQQVVPDVASIRLLQLAKNTTTNNSVALTQTLVPRADPWGFFGWIYLYDWTVQTREVVRFEGDVNTITLVSMEYSLQPFAPSSLEIPQSAGRYLKVLALYATGMFGVVALVMLLYTAHSKGRVLGRNLFRFNRVAGSVWVGRIFLFLRGMTAVCLLGTSNVTFTTNQGFVFFDWIPYTVLETLLVSGEATWVIYMMQDVLVAFLHEHSYYAAPMSSSLAWAIVFALERHSSIKATLTLNRTCLIITSAKQLRCNSAQLQFGRFSRVLTILVAQTGSVFLFYAVAVWRRWRRHIPPMTLLISGPSEAFLDIPTCHEDDRESWTSFDKVTCVMCGLLSYHSGYASYVFDLKSWTIIKQNDVEAKGSRQYSCAFQRPTFKQLPTSSPLTSGKPFSWLNRCFAVAGLSYMMASLAGSILYIFSTERNMANDFWWAGFNSTGAQAYLGNWYATQLMLNPNAYSDALDDTKYGDPTGYNTSSTTISVSQLYAKTVQFEAINTIESAIDGLRRLDACAFTTVMTQYCWLDFHRQYPMANTAARQHRCLSYATNGAVFLEAGLRNIQWSQFTTCHGAAFETAFANDLRGTQDGTTWLHNVQNVVTSASDEAIYWRTFQLQSYTTQYQNFKMLGLIETFNIQNAFGVTYPMTIKSSRGVFQYASQSSQILYWSFDNDLSGVVTGSSPLFGRSLLASSANFAYANTSVEAALVTAGYLSWPVGSTFAALRQTLGPFGSIDARHVVCPQSLRQFYKRTSQAIATLVSVNAAAQNDYLSLPFTASWLTCPPPWLNLSRFPGNVMCPASGTKSSTAMLSLWVDGGCSSLTESTYPTRMSNFIASLATNTADVAATCNAEKRNPAMCRTLLNESQVFANKYWDAPTLATFAAEAALAQRETTVLNVSFLQFSSDTGAALTLQLFGIANFYYFSWNFAVEWLLGTREVVSFEGDVGTLVLLSSVSLATALPPNPLEISANVALYFRGVVLYITAILCLVSAMATVYILASGGRIEGLNMLELSRVGGIVWTGRSLLFLRSMVAISLLSTVTLDLVQYGPLGGMTRFESGHLEWYKLILAAGEVGWLVYVLVDIIIIFTRAYTTTYAVLCGLLVWMVAAIFSVGFPVAHSATVDRTCLIMQLDFQLACDAGTVTVGSVSRFLQLIAIALGCIVGCYAIERIRQPHLKDSRATASLLLSSSSKYLFALDDWKFKDAYYLDKASAVITGILCIEHQTKFYVLDIKLWRTFVVEVPDELAVPQSHNMYYRSQHAFPLIGSGV